jgi:hypothetical protein
MPYAPKWEQQEKREKRETCYYTTYISEKPAAYIFRIYPPKHWYLSMKLCITTQKAVLVIFLVTTKNMSNLAWSRNVSITQQQLRDERDHNT